MPPRPRRLKVLDDGSLELPLASRVNDQGVRESRDTLTLPPDPSMVEVARLHDLVVSADEKMAELTEPLPEVPPALQAKAERIDALRRAKDKGDELVEAVEAVTVDERDLLRKRAEVMRDRNRVAYSAVSPHGLALLEAVELLTGRTLEPADLPGWAGHWTVLGEVLARYTDPLAGRAEALVEEAVAAATAATQEVGKS